jgi:serine protease AprX
LIHRAFKLNKTAVWQRIIGVLLLVVVLIPTTGIVPAHGAAAYVHGSLLAAAAQSPDTSIAVIVQKTTKDRSVESAVNRLGGTITRDLHIINAIVAQLPAKNIVQLAKTPGVRAISPDAPVQKTASSTVDTSHLLSAYIKAISADRVWNTSPYVQGQGVAVAVIDTGVTFKPDFSGNNGNGSRIVVSRNFITGTTSTADGFGHGTHVAGIIGGNGGNSGGAYIGVAPKANLVNLRVGDNAGAATSSDVVEAMQWIYDNKAAYNIRVLNLSLGSTLPESYMVSPMDAAAEILWFDGVVVVASAGNTGPAGVLSAPANDPFVITVGATDDQGTASILDDTMALYSSFGVTQDGFAKPEIVAPGTDIVSVLASLNETLVQGHEDHIVTIRGEDYLRLSGTSMAAAVTSGAAALLLQAQPTLNPDQVKYRLMFTAGKTSRWPAYNQLQAGSGYLNVQTAINTSTTATANTGTRASQLLWTGDTPVDWQSVNWGSVNWGSVNWGSVNWGSVNWGSVNWGSVYWEP